MHIRTLSVSLACLFVTPACFTPSDDSGVDGLTGSSDDTTATAESNGDDASSAASASATDDHGDADATDADTSATDPTDATGGTDPTDPTDGDTDATTADATTTDATDATTTDAGETDTTATDDGTSTDTGMPVETRLVFVTSTSYLPITLPGASAACQSVADDAGVPGTFLAWVSYAGFEPASDFAQFDGQYVLSDGNVVADDWDDLVDGTLDHAINRDENGDLSNGIEVWTNTDDDGTVLVGGNSQQNCTAFTSTNVMQTARIGRTTASSDEWTDYAVQPCAVPGHFYCFEQ